MADSGVLCDAQMMPVNEVDPKSQVLSVEKLIEKQEHQNTADKDMNNNMKCTNVMDLKLTVQSRKVLMRRSFGNLSCIFLDFP